MAVLIATVAFAAAYTIPGGPNQSTVTRLQEVSSSKVDARFYVFDPFRVDDDGGIWCNSHPYDTK
ncbi:unnamed protein product, partial [Vitis vinifera]|uniref:PGG domain-containing protein n=1 Tax=Vitis vinifera TaxID=29760 RepID=D7SSV0_VITVI